MVIRCECGEWHDLDVCEGMEPIEEWEWEELMDKHREGGDEDGRI